MPCACFVNRSTASEHGLQLMATGQAVPQPLAEKEIELVLLIRLVHLRVGVVIDAAEAPGHGPTDLP